MTLQAAIVRLHLHSRPAGGVWGEGESGRGQGSLSIGWDTPANGAGCPWLCPSTVKDTVSSRLRTQSSG